MVAGSCWRFCWFNFMECLAGRRVRTSPRARRSGLPTRKRVAGRDVVACRLSGHLTQWLADRQALAVEQMAVGGVQLQSQRLAIARREVAADAHGQGLVGLGEDVAKG